MSFKVFKVNKKFVYGLYDLNLKFYNVFDFNSKSPARAPAVEEKSVEPAKSARLYVGRITRNLTKDHVIEIFSTYGVIKSTELPMDTHHPLLHKGFAYVEYEKWEDAEKAMK